MCYCALSAFFLPFFLVFIFAFSKNLPNKLVCSKRAWLLVVRFRTEAIPHTCIVHALKYTLATRLLPFNLRLSNSFGFTCSFPLGSLFFFLLFLVYVCLSSTNAYLFLLASNYIHTNRPLIILVVK